jgi:hypothetical protein
MPARVSTFPGKVPNRCRRRYAQRLVLAEELAPGRRQNVDVRASRELRSGAFEIFA